MIFLSNTMFENDSFTDADLLKSFYWDVGYDLKYGDKKSDRNYKIKLLEKRGEKNKKRFFEFR